MENLDQERQSNPTNEPKSTERIMALENTLGGVIQHLDRQGIATTDSSVKNLEKIVVALDPLARLYIERETQREKLRLEHQDRAGKLAAETETARLQATERTGRWEMWFVFGIVLTAFLFLGIMTYVNKSNDAVIVLATTVITTVLARLGRLAGLFTGQNKSTVAKEETADDE